MSLKAGTYWLTRIVFLRSLAFVYHVAFWVALSQNRGLLGRNGLLPVDLYLEDIKERLGPKADDDHWLKIANVPTILWFVDWTQIDFYLDLLSYIGLCLSFLILVTGASNMIAMTVLWIVYHSIVNVGQTWYSFGWESQLLETGFLAIWFCPLLTWKQLPKDTPPSWVVVYGYRWLIFRIMIGAGLIKIRGDQCWRDLTCMDYHYQTQPVPNPNAYFMHQSPAIFHKFEVVANHFVELIVPFMLWIPYRPCIILGGLIQIGFMCMIIVSGNLSFLNHLTILPSICCLDDRFLSFLFAKPMLEKLEKILESQLSSERKPVGYYIRQVANISLFVLIAYLSIPVVQNVLSRRQLMNTSFEPLRLVNTYGAFGSITKERTEIIMEGTMSNDPNAPGTQWREYEFKCKPGNITRRPCQISPYHYRLDWLMWFAAFQNYQYNPWLVHLVAKMLKNDPLITDLIAYNPFQGEDPPKFIRLEHYLYEFTKTGSEEAKRGDWWKRKRISNYMPPVNYQSLRTILRKFKWSRKLK